MSSTQGGLFDVPNMLLGLGAFAAVTALGIAARQGNITNALMRRG